MENVDEKEINSQQLDRNEFEYDSTTTVDSNSIANGRLDSNSIANERLDSSFIEEENNDKSNLNLPRTSDINREAMSNSNRPDSLNIESVLEYTNKIKVFLGLGEDNTELKLDECLINSDQVIDALEERKKENKDSYLRQLPNQNSIEEHAAPDKHFIDESSNLKTKQPFENVLSSASPSPDIFGGPMDSEKEKIAEQYSDILEAGKNQDNISDQSSRAFKNINNNILDTSTQKENLPDFENLETNNVFSSEQKREEISEIIDGKTNNIMIQETADNVPKNDLEEEKRVDPDSVPVNDFRNFAGGGVYQEENKNDNKNDGDKSLSLIPPTLSDEKKFFLEDSGIIEDTSILSHTAYNSDVDKNEDSDDGKPYQVIYIEEGLREVEKVSKISIINDVELPKKETVAGTSNQNHYEFKKTDSPESQRSALNIEYIRKLSSEVVDSVLQSAGEQVKVILRRQMSNEETNKPSTSEYFSTSNEGNQRSDGTPKDHAYQSEIKAEQNNFNESTKSNDLITNPNEVSNSDVSYSNLPSLEQSTVVLSKEISLTNNNDHSILTDSVLVKEDTHNPLRDNDSRQAVLFDEAFLSSNSESSTLTDSLLNKEDNHCPSSAVDLQQVISHEASLSSYGNPSTPTELDLTKNENTDLSSDNEQGKVSMSDETVLASNREPSTLKDLERISEEIFSINTEKENSEDDTENSESSEPKLKKKLSMKQIRRLSSEVVSSVLQSAEDQVRVILRDRNSFKEASLTSTSTDHKENYIKEDETTDLNKQKELTENITTNTLKEASLENIPTDVCQNLPPFTQNLSSYKENIRFLEKPTVTKSTEIINAFIEEEMVLKHDDDETQCGFGPFKFKCLQPYATANSYLVLYSILGILHGSYYTYLVGVLTTLEKRFEFKSKTSGAIMILDELTPLFLGVLVGHFAGRVHRPRLLSLGMFLSAFCCFASALPYFLYGTATHLTSQTSFDVSVQNRTGIEMCDGDMRTSHCGEDDRPPTMTAILLLMLGSFLKGFGNIAYYAIGIAYLDDNAKKKNTPLYLGVALSLRLIGPMTGFLLSSAFLKYYENPFETPDYGPNDPRWIGGWWMGFMLQGILLLIFAGPMAFFPRRLPELKTSQIIKVSSSTKMFDGLSASLKRLITNPLFILLNINAILIVYGNFGFHILLPKYMENQFRLSASSASLFSGPPGIAAFIVSTVLGGYLIWKFRPSARFLTGGLVVVEIISTLGYLLLMIPRCETIDMVHFGYGDDSLILESSCNTGCNCSTVSFTPICGPDGKKSYFSPCYAGCSVQAGKLFSNCSCIDGYEDATATKGMCSSENCWSQALAYIVTLPILQFTVNIFRVAYTMIILRSIRPEDKNIALGLFEAVLSTVAFIPFPILYGALVDSACLVWEKSCNETGNCWFYDIQKFNYILHGMSAFFCGLSTFVLIAIFFLVNRIKDLYKDEDDTGHLNTTQVTEVEKDEIIVSVKL